MKIIVISPITWELNDRFTQTTHPPMGHTRRGKVHQHLETIAGEVLLEFYRDKTEVRSQSLLKFI